MYGYQLYHIEENKNDNLTKDTENDTNLIKSIFVKPSSTKDKERAWHKWHCQKSFPKLL